MQRRHLLIAWALKLATLSALLVFLWRAASQWAAAPTLTLTLLIVGELVTVVVYLTARTAKAASFSPVAVVSTLCGTFYFLVVILDEGQPLAPILLTASLQIFGIVWQIASKLSLGRSFGLLPANRGIVTRGTYRYVRHPIYLGYLIAHVGFLLASFSWQNFFLYLALYFFQGLRIREEERLLKADASYRDYMLRTRYRIFPGII